MPDTEPDPYHCPLCGSVTFPNIDALVDALSEPHTVTFIDPDSYPLGDPDPVTAKRSPLDQ